MLTPVLLAAAAAVPQQRPEPLLGREVRHVLYDAATGAVVDLGRRVVGDPAYEAVSSTFANTLLQSWSPTDGDEWVDWGLKTGGATGPVCEFDVAYATDVCDDPPGSGTVELDVAFFEGTTGFCVKGTEVARFVLSGLPGDADCGDGASEIVLVTVSLTTEAFFLPDGDIGWSYTTTGSTAPLLVLATHGFSSCISPAAPTPGTSDCLDRYSPGGGAGVCTSTFSFFLGLTSTYLELREETGAPASSSARFGVPPNPGAMATLTPPVVGASWTATVVTPAVATPLLDFLAISTGPSAPSTGLPVGPALTVLIDLTPPNPFVVLTGPPHAPLVAPVPVNCAFVGLPLSGQMGQVDASGAIGGTNAEDVVIGSF